MDRANIIESSFVTVQMMEILGVEGLECVGGILKEDCSKKVSNKF